MERYTQDDYYHFSAFFSRITLQRPRDGKGVPTLLAYNREQSEIQNRLDELAPKNSNGG